MGPFGTFHAQTPEVVSQISEEFFDLMVRFQYSHPNCTCKRHMTGEPLGTSSFLGKRRETSFGLHWCTFAIQEVQLAVRNIMVPEFGN